MTILIHDKYKALVHAFSSQKPKKTMILNFVLCKCYIRYCILIKSGVKAVLMLSPQTTRKEIVFFYILYV